MSRSRDSSRACDRYARLRRADEATSLNGSDRAFLTEHSQTCAECADFDAVLETVRWDDAERPVEPLDQLTRRRVINAAVARVDDVSASPPAEQPATQEPDRPAQAGPSYVRYYLAAACVLLAVGLLWWSPWKGGGERGLSVDSATAERHPARFVLLAGTVRTPAGSATLDRSLRAGDWIETGPRGRAVLRLRQGATVVLEGGSRLSVQARDASAVTLQRGRLLALVDPQRPRSRFSVVTPFGRVTVTGTVFEVVASGDGARAAVLRGQLRVSGRGGAAQALEAGHEMTVGGTESRPLDDGARRRMWRLVKLLDLLQADRPATLVVTSRPVGAAVAVDGADLGSTPLAVRLRAGHRRLELSARDHATVREHLLMKGGARTTRDFELRRAPETKAAVRPPADPKTAPSAPRVVTRRPSARPRPEATQAQDLRRALLNRAQLLRTAQDWRNAARAYGELIRRYPRSAEATTALVSLGILQLRHLGQPAKGLRSFDRYLRRSRRGALAREAAYGRILALRALGRRTAEIGALQDFLRRHPKALRAARVRRRLQTLTAASRPPGRGRP